MYIILQNLQHVNGFHASTKSPYWLKSIGWWSKNQSAAEPKIPFADSCESFAAHKHLFSRGRLSIWFGILIIISDHLPVWWIRFSALGKEHSFFLTVYIVARKSNTNLPVLVPYKFGAKTQFVASWIGINDFLQVIIYITRKVLQTDTAGHQLNRRRSVSIANGAGKNSN